jgi:hypothetical protein
MTQGTVSSTGRVTRSLLALLTGLTAVSAVAGGVGLASGAVDMGATITQRFPWHSALLAGLALLVVVGAPMALTSMLAFRNQHGQQTAAVVAGALLIGWIVVEIAVVREFNWLQVVFGVDGLVVFLAGLRRGNVRTR